MRNRSDQILDQWESDQEAQNNLAMASTIDMHMGQMFPNRKAAQDLAQRMAGVNTAGNFLRDLGAARLGTTQAARMGRVDPAEMLREKLVGSMTNRLSQVGQAGGPGSMSDVFAEFNPAMSLMGGQPYEPRKDPMAAMSDRGTFARMLGLMAAQNGQQIDPVSINRTVDSLFGANQKQSPSDAPPVAQAAAGLQSSVSNPLLAALGITPNTSAANVSDVIHRRMAPGSQSPLNEEELQQIISHARNMRSVRPEWAEGLHNSLMLQQLLNLTPGQSATDGVKSVQQRMKDEADMLRELMSDRNSYGGGF